jgi:hypothetical protein
MKISDLPSDVVRYLQLSEPAQPTEDICIQIRDWLGQARPAGTAQELDPANIVSIEQTTQNALEIFFRATYKQIVTLDPEQHWPRTYKQVAQRIAQDQQGLVRALPEIVRELIEKNGYDHILESRGLSRRSYVTAKKSGPKTIDILFDAPFTPWLSFVVRCDQLRIRGGPFIYDYTLYDDHCTAAKWQHGFAPRPELNTSMYELARTSSNIRRQTLVNEAYSTTHSGFVIKPSRFPRSSNTPITDYEPRLDFEIREEIVPVTALSYVLQFLREKTDFKINPNLTSPSYTEPIGLEDQNRQPNRTCVVLTRKGYDTR